MESRAIKKVNKTAIFIAVDTILVMMCTWLWFYAKGEKNSFTESIEYTIYITIIFGIYYYAFDLLWTNSLKHFVNGSRQNV